MVPNSAGFFQLPRIGYTPESPSLFSETLSENILLGFSGESHSIDAAVRAATLDKDIKTLEQGLDTLVGSRGVKLSGGQVLRTAAARMFVRGAELNLIDDISSGLDIDTQGVFWQRFFDRKLTGIVVTHRRETLELADHILLMEEGRVAAQGTLHWLLQNSAAMSEVWASYENRPDT